VRTLAIAIIATVALLFATPVVHADSTGCAPTVEATDTTGAACAPGVFDPGRTRAHERDYAVSADASGADDYDEAHQLSTRG
jgi:hypothetical protein